MPRAGEYTYFEKIGPEGRRHSINKPFSGAETPRLFMDMGALFSLLPPPPARILECGCGTGWLCYFLARKGYDVVGQDCSSDAIQLARTNALFTETGKVEFLCSDFEELGFENEFDAVVFYAALHHAQRAREAIHGACRALRKGGVFVAVEPGRGHQAAAGKTIEKCDVGDRDMPPRLVVREGRRAGFTETRIYQHPGQLTSTLYAERPHSKALSGLWRIPGMRVIFLLASILFYKRFNGLVWMKK